MEIRGHIHNGVVVFESDSGLPEGAPVVVSPLTSRPVIVMKAGELPVVEMIGAGCIELTNQFLNEILDQEEIAAMKGVVNVPS